MHSFWNPEGALLADYMARGDSNRGQATYFVNQI